MPPATAHRTTGFGAAGIGLGLLVTVLIGGAQSSPLDHYWAKPSVIAAIVLSTFLVGVGLWALGSVYLGLPWPRTHVERRESRDAEALARRQSVELHNAGLDQLDSYAESIVGHLQTGLRAGHPLSPSACISILGTRQRTSWPRRTTPRRRAPKETRRVGQRG
jgi:hypothetical protein